MKQVTGLTDSANQKMNIVVGENETIEFHLYYCPTQHSWYFDWEYENIKSAGNKVTLSPNILRQFKNIIPFGIGFYSDDLVPPLFKDDFLYRIKMYILDKDDIEEVEESIFNPLLLLDNQKYDRGVIG